MSSKKPEREKRTPAEWVTLAVSSMILAVVLGAIAIQVPGSDELPAPTARVDGEPRQVDGRWFVPVEVGNDGDLTAENVQVSAELVVGAETFEAEQTVDFLSGGATQKLEFVFDEDPGAGELTVEVSGYRDP